MLSDLSLLPKLSGIYYFADKNNNVLYVGKAKNLYNRVHSYFSSPLKLGEKTQQLVSQIVTVYIQPTDSEIDALLLESETIKRLQPKYNIELKDGKRYEYVAISKTTTGRSIVSFTRKQTTKGVKYFGPFPGKPNIRLLLRKLRQIYPYMTTDHSPERCLPADIGLCSCKQSLKEASDNIKSLSAILRGQKGGMVKTLKRKMHSAADKNLFELATKYKSTISQIETMFLPSTPTWEYEENPNLYFDRRMSELVELQKVLELPQSPNRIEMYDIAHTGGSDTTASMVVFLLGMPSNKDYRHFKIKSSKNDDYLSLNETIGRRLKHQEWPLPDVLAVDGGPGQVKTAKNLLRNQNVLIIGLSKNLETIHLADGRNIQLTKDSPALQLLQRIRDEAHRFARRYHFYLRNRRVLSLSK